MSSVAVIGGGVAGLAAAHRIVERVPGAEVVVLEAEARAGGVLRSSGEGGWLHEHAANAFLSGTPDGAVALCRELGVELEEPAPAAKQRWIWRGGRLHALPRGPADLLRTGLLSWRGKLALLGEPLRAARPPSAHGDESIYDFAARRLGPETADAIVAPFVTGIFAGDARQVSLAAGFPKIASLEEAGGLLRGVIRSSWNARRAGGARPEPPRSVAPRGGAEALVRALADRLGARVERGARVEAVRPDGDGVVVTAAGRERRHDAAVLAAPAHETARMLGGAPELAELAHTAMAVRYAPAVVAYLGYRRADVAHPLDGFGLLVAAGEAPRVLGIVLESTVWSGRAPEGHVLLRCILGGTRDPDVFDLPDDAVLGIARDDARRILGIDAAPVHTRVVRWRHGIAQYPVGHGTRVAKADQLARTYRMVLAGSAWHGVAVTDCVSDATRVATEVVRWLA
jgi:protoporphyrinogen/coproporphyrinogen III oxidase